IDLRADVQKEIDRLIAEFKAGGLDNAARYLVDNRAAVVEIAVKARLEPKTRELPSPFDYSMQ
ncbi:hypothetical protein, partial [Reyranella sp.]|uniref:hypothetical protein n=1 Tax=Reyranella sp. TaxID=1929291 RepID=UPI003D0B34A2